jgi:photosystem II stability/assembly factor-like uncharacterized protein
MEVLCCHHALIFTPPAWALLPSGKALKCMFAWTKRLLTLTLFAALAVMPPCVLRAQWEKVNGPSVVGIGTITVSGQNIYSEVGSVIYLSTDTGTTWEPLTVSGKVAQWVGGSGEILFVETQDSFYISRNSGITWINDSSISKIAGFSSFSQIGSILFACGYISGNSPGIERSTDSGSTWIDVNNGLPNSYRQVWTSVVIDTELYALVAYGTLRGQVQSIFRSTDFGASWALRSDSAMSFNSIAAIGPILIAAEEYGGVLRSIDGGLTWTLSNLTENFDLQCMFVNGTGVFAGGPTDRAWIYGNILRSTDGGVS